MRSKYLIGGRGPDEFDCWGIIRSARHDLYGRALLPPLDGVRRAYYSSDFRSMKSASELITHNFGKVVAAPTPGAVAVAFRASLCIHVGLVVSADGKIAILETTEKTGPCLTPINKFTSKFTRVLFYDDKDLSEPVTWITA